MQSCSTTYAASRPGTPQAGSEFQITIVQSRYAAAERE
jgi:hypothetical protein